MLTYHFFIAFLYYQILYKRLGYEWNVFLKWMNTNKEYKFGMHQFFEELVFDNGKLMMESSNSIHVSSIDNNAYEK